MRCHCQGAVGGNEGHHHQPHYASFHTINRGWKPNFNQSPDEIGIKMSAGEAVAFKEEEAEAVEEATKAVEEAVAEVEEEIVTEESAEAEEEVEKSLTDLVLELDEETIAAIASKVSKEVAVPAVDVSAIEAAIKALSGSVDSLGAMVTHLLKADEEKVQEMQKQLPRFRAGLSYRPSAVIATKTDAPAEPVIEASEATGPEARNLASDIEAIQEYRRQNLRVVHG